MAQKKLQVQKEGDLKSDVKNNNNVSKNKKNFTGIIILLLVVLIAAVGILIYVLLTKKNETIVNEIFIPRETTSRPALGGRGTVLTEDNYEELIKKINAPNPDKRYRVSMSSKWEFETWDTPSNSVFVRNREENSRTVCVDLYLNNENDEPTNLVYSSPYIPLGETLRKFSLDKEVPVGEHKATVIYTLVDDDFNEVTTLSVGIKLLIKN